MNIEEKIEEINRLIEEVEIYDFDNPEWMLEVVRYNVDEDKYYFYCK